MSAVLMQFPEKVQRRAKRRLNRVELEAHHRWLQSKSAHWETEETHGVEYEKCLAPRSRQLLKLLDKEWGKIPKPKVPEIRAYIAEQRTLIEKRNRVKAWMRSLGIDLDGATTAEQALFFLFDHMHGRKPPSIA